MVWAAPGFLHGVAASPRVHDRVALSFTFIFGLVIPGSVEAIYIPWVMVVSTVSAQLCFSIFFFSFSKKDNALVCFVSISISVLSLLISQVWTTWVCYFFWWWLLVLVEHTQAPQKENKMAILRMDVLFFPRTQRRILSKNQKKSCYIYSSKFVSVPSTNNWCWENNGKQYETNHSECIITDTKDITQKTLATSNEWEYYRSKVPSYLSCICTTCHSYVWPI